MGFLQKYQKDFEEYDYLEQDFIDDELIWALLKKKENPSRAEVRSVLDKNRRRWRSSFKTKIRKQLMKCIP